MADVNVYTLAQLTQDATRVIEQINEQNRSAFVTQHGRDACRDRPGLVRLPALRGAAAHPVHGGPGGRNAATPAELPPPAGR